MKTGREQEAEAFAPSSSYARAVAWVYASADDTEEAREVISALTAAPEKPKVDVRKVWAAAWLGCNGDHSRALAKLITGLRAAGVEVVE